MGAFASFLRNLGPVRLAIMGIVFVAMIFFFTFAMNRLTGENMSLLFSDLDRGDQAAITAQLSSRGVRYELQGSRILVPADQVGSLRIAMAAQGLPGGGVAGYEIFDDANALGTTNFMQNIQLVRALEGELSKTIRSIDSVRNARVHLVMSKRELFSRDKQTATASVVLQMRGAQKLTNVQIASIQHLVSSAVPDLDPGRVSIVDTKGNLLARGDDENSDVSRTNDLVQRRVSFEKRLVNEITDLLEKSVGSGNVKVTVRTDLDFDRISTTEEVFDPDGQVVRSSTTIEESAQSQENQGAQPVTVQTNLPEAGTGESAAGSRNAENRTEELTNFEISKKITNHVRESGIIKKMSVAVLVDGSMVENADGDPQYRARTPEELENLRKLVLSTVGFNEGRGDIVEVINMRFSDEELEVDVPLDLFFGLQKNDLLRIAEVVVLLILAVLVILLVVRPLMSRFLEALPAAAAVAEQRLLEEAAAAAPVLSAPEAPPDEEAGYEELIDIDRVEGRVKASSVKKVGEIVEKHPEEALSIIRNWMYQEG